VDTIFVSHLTSISDAPSILYSLALRTGEEEDEEVMILYCETQEEKIQLQQALTIARRA
jgi:hypothetical protein